jgi:quercetin dioxygenase-like cupin family protein
VITPEHEGFGTARQQPVAPQKGPAVEVTGPAVSLPGHERGYFLDRGHGHRVTLLGQLVTTLVSKNESDGKFSLTVLEGPPDDAVPAHFHTAESEFWYVLEGSLRVWLGDEQRLLHPGDCAYLPANVVHSFRLEGSYTKFMGFNFPGGFEGFFDVLGKPYDQFMAPVEKVIPTPEQWQEAASKFVWFDVPDYDFGL